MRTRMPVLAIRVPSPTLLIRAEFPAIAIRPRSPELRRYACYSLHCQSVRCNRHWRFGAAYPALAILTLSPALLNPGIIFRTRQRTTGFLRGLLTGNIPHCVNILLEQNSPLPAISTSRIPPGYLPNRYTLPAGAR